MPEASKRFLILPGASEMFITHLECPESSRRHFAVVRSLKRDSHDWDRTDYWQRQADNHILYTLDNSFP